MNKILYTILILNICLKNINCAKILGIFPSPVSSHYTLGSVILKELAKKGHDVKMLAVLNEKKPVENLTIIQLNDFKNALSKRINSKFFLSMKENNAFQMELSVGKGGYFETRAIIKDANFKKLLKSNETFDLIIIELFQYEALYALSHHYNAPLVGISLRAPSPWSKDLVGNPVPYSYVPNHNTEFSDKMTFKQRLINSAIGVFSEVYRYFFYIPWHESLVRKYLPDSPNLRDIISNASLVLTNSHESYSPPMPLVPSMIPIGGFHVSRPKPLPEDLQKILDESINGAIYFSMGGNLKSIDFPENVRDAFVEAFSKINQTILWKWEDINLPNKPQNVITKDWLPQADILAHKNVKLFITHGGVLSLIETLDRGVPVINIPIYGDQRLSAMETVNNGYGILLEYDEITSEKVLSTLNEAIYNPKYKENAKRKSFILRDQQVPPLEKAIFSIEYVLRHKGAAHLRVASLDLNIFQYLLLDVLAFILFIIIIIVLILIYSCKLLFRCKQKVKKSNYKI